MLRLECGDPSLHRAVPVDQAVEVDDDLALGFEQRAELRLAGDELVDVRPVGIGRLHGRPLRPAQAPRLVLQAREVLFDLRSGPRPGAGVLALRRALDGPVEGTGAGVERAVAEPELMQQVVEPVRQLLFVGLGLLELFLLPGDAAELDLLEHEPLEMAGVGGLHRDVVEPVRGARLHERGCGADTAGSAIAQLVAQRVELAGGVAELGESVGVRAHLGLDLLRAVDRHEAGELAPAGQRRTVFVGDGLEAVVRVPRHRGLDPADVERQVGRRAGIGQRRRLQLARGGQLAHRSSDAHEGTDRRAGQQAERHERARGSEDDARDGDDAGAGDGRTRRRSASASRSSTTRWVSSIREITSRVLSSTPCGSGWRTTVRPARLARATAHDCIR